MNKQEATAALAELIGTAQTALRKAQHLATEHELSFSVDFANHLCDSFDGGYVKAAVVDINNELDEEIDNLWTIDNVLDEGYGWQSSSATC